MAFARRLATAAIILLAASAIVFFAMRLLPGDPALLWLGSEYDPATHARLIRQWGLDRPLLEQYAAWLGNLAAGDLGRSLSTRSPVADDLLRRLPVTLELIALALLIAIAIGVAAGLIAALRRNRAADHAALGFTLLGISLPEFFIGALLMLVFALWLGWLPATGYAEPGAGLWSHLSHLTLPAIALGVPRSAVICRLTRTALLEVFARPYIRTAVAKGLSTPAIVLRHALKNAAIPVVTVLGLQLGYLVGGAVVVETLFVIPGLGSWGVNALLARDYPAVQAFVLVTAAVFVLANLLVDLAYLALDPRQRGAALAR
jgi:peptide/nickel transport system permease protein